MRIGSDYFCYLLDQIKVLSGEYEDYMLLAQHLFNVNYIPIFELDQNRAEGGLNIRRSFADDLGIDLDFVKQGECTVLEMLIGLATVISVRYEEPIEQFFWEMVGNLGLLNCTDEHFSAPYVDQQLKVWLNHTYKKNGDGSIFPLRHPAGDCRNMLIWDMMNAYLHENYPITTID